MPAGDARASSGWAGSGDAIRRAPPGRATRRAGCGHRSRGYVLAVAILCAHAAVTFAADEPFRARVSEADGVVRVVVDVLDERVVFGGEPSGRVTVYLADARVIADDAAMRRSFATRRREVETALAAAPRDAAEVRAVRDGLHEAAERWRGNVQLLEAEIASSPQRPAAAPASSRYEITPRGYRATLTIPLLGVLSPTNASVPALRYRLEVGGVVRPGRPATTMTKSGRLKLRHAWHLPLDETQRVARELAPGGRFELRDGAYVYVLPAYGSTDFSFDGTCCTSNAPIPDRWTPLEPRNVSHLEGLRLYIGPEAVLVAAGGRHHRLELTEAEPLFQARRGGAYYLLFLDNQWSRPGSSSSMCGAGTETSVVWIELSTALVEQRQQSLLIGSCWYNLEGDYQTDATRVWGETDRIDYHTGAHTTHLAYEYDNAHPQRGLVTMTKPAP